MSGKGNDSRPPLSPIGPRPLLIWVFLSATIATTVAVRGRDPFWPMIAWIMYARIEPPPPVAGTIRIDVTTESGGRLSFFPPDLLTHVESPFVESLMWQSFGSTGSVEASRRYLVRLLVRKVRGDRINSVSGWRCEWDVSPQHVRTFRRERPDREALLGTFQPGQGRR